MPSNCPRCDAELSAHAAFCPRCGSPVGAARGEPEFRAWRIRVCKRAITVCAGLFVVGLLFLRVNPETTLIVSGLALLGVMVGLIRLSRLPPP